MPSSKEMIAGMRGVGMITAEKYAEFFMRHSPQVAAVWVFGSVALRGDGHDVDLVLELTDEDLGRVFLLQLKEKVDKIQKDKQGRIPRDSYGELKRFRYDLAFAMLGLDREILRGELREIEWNGQHNTWNSQCIEKKWIEAVEIEKANFRELDIFLMPRKWRANPEVEELLPNWASDRPWAKRSFYRIMAMQSRLWNKITGRFEKRKRSSRADEELLLQAIVEELGYRENKSE